MRIGVFFGGQSREREVSFAGGRTVFDNLDKNLFEAIPIFIDSLGQFILLDWQYVYKGTIRDFYPPNQFLPESPNNFQIYVESLQKSKKDLKSLASSVGRVIEPSEFSELFDFAFLALHGSAGEDGSIQGILEWYSIPYSGSGILPSAIGIDKSKQKSILATDGLSPKYSQLSKSQWDNDSKEKIYADILSIVGQDFVVKAPHQGSSIGISVLKNPDYSKFHQAIQSAFFREAINLDDWRNKNLDEKKLTVATIADLRTGIGFPLLIDNEKLVHHPEELFQFLEQSDKTLIQLQSIYSESELLIESFIEGEEFSCIVIEDESGKSIALPPTQIVKRQDLFDYRSKYLPGISRKITPINLPDKDIQNIRTSCESLFKKMNCDVYARIDGFINKQGQIYLNDPNTTSGMMPSSFFFHQAAEIGLNPSQFLTFIIRSSLSARIRSGKYSILLNDELKALDNAILNSLKSESQKETVAVIMGGYSTERHISVESGRNIYEKLSSSKQYQAIPIFLSGDSTKIELYQIPINIMLKDNADDIRDKIQHYSIHPLIESIKNECSVITAKYTGNTLNKPKNISIGQLAEKVDSVFIALHGRPGEDGTIQKMLEQVGLPYNGSLPESSEITINKFETNAFLRSKGVKVANHAFVLKSNWLIDPNSFFENIENSFGYPFIAKPADDGCSSAVRKIKNRIELESFANLIFRENIELNENDSKVLKLNIKEEFPIKEGFLIETLITKLDAEHFLEITGGLLTKYDNQGEVNFEIFEPSETLAIGEVLSLEEKFLAGEGQNITPARYDKDKDVNSEISRQVKNELKKVAEILDIQGYARIDAFVKIYKNPLKVELYVIEINSLPGMTPATCIFHQSAINKYTPLAFIDQILKFGKHRKQKQAIER